MQELLRVFFGHTIAAIVLFILLFSAIGFAFIREKVLRMYIGFFTMLLSLITSPFVYFKNGLLRLAEQSAGTDKFSSTRQYLLNKFLSSLETVVVIIALLILTAGLINAYIQFLPPERLRNEISNLEKKIDDVEKELKPQQKTLDKLNSDWEKIKDQKMIELRKPVEEKVSKAKLLNSQYENKFSSINDIASSFQSIKNTLKQYETYNSYQWENAKRWAQNNIYYLYTSQEIKDQLNAYTENWYSLMFLQNELNGLTEENIRSQIQTEYSNTNYIVQKLTNDFTYYQNNLDSRRAEAKYNFKEFFFSFGYSIGLFVVFIWVLGLATELLWLNVDVATNIALIKKQFLKE